MAVGGAAPPAGLDERFASAHVRLHRCNDAPLVGAHAATHGRVAREGVGDEMPVRSSVILSCARQRNARGARRDQDARSSTTYGPAWGHASALAESGKAIGKVTLSEF